MIRNNYFTLLLIISAATKSNTPEPEIEDDLDITADADITLTAATEGINEIESDQRITDLEIKVAELQEELELAKAQIRLQVQRSWAEVYTAVHKFELLDKLYAQFSEITRAAELRLETEASSKLEYLSLVNQANDLKIQTDQARQDYRAAISAFNQWFGGDSLYTTEALSRELLDIPVGQFDSSGTHPLLMKAEQNIEVSEAESKSIKSAFLPRLEASYSAQEISGQTGFYSYEVGIRVPLFFWSQLGKTQSSQIQTKITRNQFEEAERTFWSMYSQAKENYIKWNNSWTYYKQEALPLAEEQQSAAITAYQEGAIDYIMFLQNLRDALNIELKAWDAFGDLLDSRYILQYYSQSSRN